MRAGAVRQLRLAAVGTGRDGGSRQRVVGPALVAAGLGVASFRIGHGRSLFRVLKSSFSLFEPALQGGQSRPAGVLAGLLAGAGTGVPVGAADRAEPLAVGAAERLHRDVEL